MVKVFGKELRLRERFKGLWSKTGTTAKRKRSFWIGEVSWRSRYQYEEELVRRHALAKSQIHTISGQLMANGVFLNPALRNGEPYPRSEEAMQKCEDLNDRLGIEGMLQDTAAGMAKHGSVFWEKTWQPIFDVRVAPEQPDIEPFKQDMQGNITHWRQVTNNIVQAEWATDEIVHYFWNRTSWSWPYGTGLMIGLDTEFDILEQLETDLKEYMHKNAFPKELWQIGDGQYMPTSISDIKSDVRNWEPGESFVTSYPIKREAGGTGDREIKSLDQVLNFLKDQCIDGLMVPPISRQWSSTEASAKEMMPWARTNLILPLQRIIKFKLEHEVYQPYLEDLGFSVRVCPEVEFEGPDAHKEENAEYFSKLVLAGVIPPKAAAKDLGYEREYEEWQKETERQEERDFERKKQLGVNQEGQDQ